MGSTGRVAWHQSKTASHGPLQPASWLHWWPQLSARLSPLHPMKIPFYFLFWKVHSDLSPWLLCTVISNKCHIKDQYVNIARSSWSVNSLLHGSLFSAFLGNFQFPLLIISPVPLLSVGCYGVRPGCTATWSDRWSHRMSNKIRAVGRCVCVVCGGRDGVIRRRYGSESGCLNLGGP